jgi:putative oxidoreductase
MSNRSEWADVVGRVFLSLMFLLGGFQKFFGWSQTESYMASRGLPWVPVLLGLAIVIEIVAGLSLLTGYMTRRGAMILFLYLIPVTLSFHSFWTYSAAEVPNQMAHFLKNITIMGGLLFVAAHGPGRFSLDSRAASDKSTKAELHSFKAA